jgi:O-antigen/teichoic acid export membrane protein
MAGSSATHFAGWAFALGTIALICAAAALGTTLATKRTLERARNQLPEPVALLLASAVALLTFMGGWVVVGLWWTAARSRRPVQRPAD